MDLVHFTILRPPEKDDLTPLNELALIAFPVRELFQVKLREFDLIVFDRFANRGILPPAYLRNIADYVRGGGALLLSVGPEFAGPEQPGRHPARRRAAGPPPGRRRAVRRRRGRLPAPGHRARRPPPGDRGAAGRQSLRGDRGRLGPLVPQHAGRPAAGAAVMEAADGAPLLVLDRVGEGRVALLLSDHIWLWSRGHDGGGPQAELLRRVAHWLMREPELEEEDLTARIEAGQLTVERRSLEPEPPPEVTVTAPDGTARAHPLDPGSGGQAMAQLPADQPGVWQVTDGRRTAFAAAAAANPAEIADLRADPARLAPILAATGGATRWLGSGAEPVLPELRRVAPGRDAQGGERAGLDRPAPQRRPYGDRHRRPAAAAALAGAAAGARAGGARLAAGRPLNALAAACPGPGAAHRLRHRAGAGGAAGRLIGGSEVG